MYTWDELKKFARAGEEWIETEGTHVASLTARLMDHLRRTKVDEGMSPAPDAVVVDAAAPVEVPVEVPAQ